MPAPVNDTTADRTGEAKTPESRAESLAEPRGQPATDDPSVCPFCGEVGTLEHGPTGRCGSCGAYTDPLSRQATQNEMGPWFIRDGAHPFRPGCRLETIERWVRSGRITADTVLRGPTTHQNWTRAARVPGVAHLLGVCHACQGGVSPKEVICGSCGAGLVIERDRQHLGLSPVRAIPGRADPGEIARSLLEPGRVAVVPVGPTGGTPEPQTGQVVPTPGTERASTRLGRLDRRVRQANRRAGVASLLAVLFAVLFALSMFMSWGNGQNGTEPGDGPASPSPTGLIGDDLSD